MCVCVCVREREREKARERDSLCACGHVIIHEASFLDPLLVDHSWTSKSVSNWLITE